MTKLSYFSVIALLTITLSACTAPYKPEPIQMQLKANSSIAVTAGVSQTFVRGANSKMLLCTQSMADAAFDQGEGGNVSYSLIDASEDQVAAQEKTNEVEMAGRTPAVLMARELMFRACEFSSNFGLNKKEAMQIYKQTLSTIGNVWATEAGNTSVTIGDTITSDANLTVQDQSNNNLTATDTTNNQSSRSSQNSVTETDSNNSEITSTNQSNSDDSDEDNDE